MRLLTHPAAGEVEELFNTNIWAFQIQSNNAAREE